MEIPAVNVNTQTGQGGVARATILLALLVTFNVLASVLIRWSNYDGVGKFLSVILLLNLVMMLVRLFLQKRGKGRVELDSTFQILYVCVMLATIAFNRGPH